MPHLKRATPVLASLNIDRTVTFYTETLGFERRGWKDDHYAIVGRDAIDIHFWKCDNPIFPKNTSCYIYVEDVDALHAEMQAAGVVHPNGPLGDKPWGVREFSILDLDGNLIRFGQLLADAR